MTSAYPQARSRRLKFGPIVATVALSALIITIAFGAWTVWSIRTVRGTLVEEARRDALALLESLLLAAQYSVATGALVDQLETEAEATRVRLAAGLIDPRRVTTASLADVLDQTESSGATVWLEGGRVVAVPEELAALIEADSSLVLYNWDFASGGAVGMTQVDSAREIVWTGTGIPTTWGGIVLWESTEGEIPGPSYGGIGELIQQIADKSNINYIMLQAPDGIVFASRPLNPVLKLADDAFLVGILDQGESATREMVFEGQPVLEAAAPFLSVDLPSGMFRVGVSLAGVNAAQDRLTFQLGLTAILLVLLSTAVVAVFVTRRSLSDLGQSYRRVETLTTRILDSIDQGVVAVDARGDVTLFNPAAEAITGHKRDAIIGRSANDLMPADDYELRRVSTDAQPSRDQTRLLQGETGTRTLVYTTTPMVSPSGLPEGAVSVIRDETAARALAERVRQVERLSEMGHLAAGVAHEIRNPLNAIALAAQELKSELSDNEAAMLATTVWEESKRLNGIIEDYLSLARPSTQPHEPLDLCEVLANLSEILRFDADKRAIDLRVILPEDPAVIRGAADELKKAVWNIAANAMAATPSGGQVALRLTQDDGAARLTIDDTGCGVPEEQRSQVFQPYFTTKSGGTGLGLAITHRIISDHDGTIDLISPVPGTNTGTRVVIVLPRADQE